MIIGGMGRRGNRRAPGPYTLAQWLLLASLSAASTAMPSKIARGDAARLKALYSEDWNHDSAESAPSENHGHAEPTVLPDVSPRAQAGRLERLQSSFGKLKAIRLDRLTSDQRDDYAVYAYQLRIRVAELRYRDYEKPLNADTAFWSDLNNGNDRAFADEAAYRGYLKQLSDIPRYFAQQIINMRAGLARGFTPPQIALQGRDATIVSVIAAKRIEDNVFYAPFRDMPGSIPAASRDALRAAARKAIAEKVIPAHRDLLTFMRGTYVPGARTALAATELPDGQAYYRSKLYEFATEDMTPEAIHALGLAEVARIKAEMIATMRQSGFDGDLPAFLAFLRRDPRFYAKTGDELLHQAAWIAKEVDGKASAWFGRLPRSRFAVLPVPPALAPFYTSGRGGPGVYFVNTYNLSARPLYALRALTLHESAPGHAFQMPLAEENQALPPFRRNIYISAYGEGWALYCEKLGDEMGLYPTPHDRFGMLSYQMWRAARLVVDTGIHAQGWSRARAQAYLHDNTALADHEIETEVDRYIAWPGQAVSYYLGEMAIVAARAKAEQALGAKFDIRHFHDTVLQTGSVPLPVLRRRIDRFIAAGGPDPYPHD
ncbi:uncharacterized protein (DUF885 family) [Sphingomonas sp. UYAg733]